MGRLGWLIVAAAASVAVPAAPASAGGGGGGGCPEPLTSGTGTVVEMRDVCFSPTVIRVRPGTRVNFVNRDPFEHNIIGANGRWGEYDDMQLDETFSRTFREPGVFPYACAFHPGMMGSVVVGRGVVVETAFVPPSPEPVETPAAELPLVVPDPPMRVSSLEPAQGWGPAALAPWAVAAAAVGFGVAQRRRRRA
ncbi:MAG TPA: plastocyanin/azurin family copper-binding protein [Actinomycetota bacterium]